MDLVMVPQLNMYPEMDMNKNFEYLPDGNVACFLCTLLIPRIVCVCVRVKAI